MTDLTYLDNLLVLLKKHNCFRFKNAGLEVELGPISQVAVSAPQPAELSAQEQQIAESQLPPDLRADDLMNYDKILNWSGSPDHDSMPMPLTNDLPLTVANP